ncbi:phenylacetate-CoA oxygenase subunit PaaI [Comamonas testosteroni]|uniref:Phenylacetic acid catabolic protein n=1 Tax=Comamonas testosteroni TaxID=285 RepID=UPI0023AB0A0B|nr:Phenylacetic acid catabolic protein [Comamonas testosteroni]WEE75369.1 phenylacetate-CoA oxygenase subunit PaaI [Comamonas testosteroni]
MKLDNHVSELPIEILAKSGSVRSPEEFHKMPLEYRELAIHLMKVHTEGELTGADDYTQVFYNLAPNAYEKLICCERAREEIEHYQLSAQVLSDLGIDTSYMLKESFLERPLYSNELVRGIKTWMERGIFSFLGEAVVLDHLQEFAESSYLPFAEIFTKQIISDEHTHIAHGYRIIRDACQTEDGRIQAQEALNRLWPHLIKLFGSADSPRTRLYIKWGLRQTSNEELRIRFVKKTVPRLLVMGLNVPDAACEEALLTLE